MQNPAIEAVVLSQVLSLVWKNQSDYKIVEVLFSFLHVKITIKNRWPIKNLLWKIIFSNRVNTSTWWLLTMCGSLDPMIRRIWEPTPYSAASILRYHNTAWPARPRQAGLAYTIHQSWPAFLLHLSTFISGPFSLMLIRIYLCRFLQIRLQFHNRYL
jgi:hypothetical protein